LPMIFGKSVALAAVLVTSLFAGELTPKLVLPKTPEPVHGPDSNVKPGVPQGKVTDFIFADSKVFVGTKRRIHLYVPAQYDPKKETALMVFQDGHAYVNPKGDYRATIVFDNLIASGDMPPVTKATPSRWLHGKTTIAASNTTHSPRTTPPFSSMKSCRSSAKITT
jgi:hypothetical protein